MTYQKEPLSDRELARLSDLAAKRISDQSAAPAIQAIGVGYVAFFDPATRKAQISKFTPDSDPIPGFNVPAGVSLRAGDEVPFYDLAPDKFVFPPLNRNASLPDDLTLASLTLTGRLTMPFLSPPPLTADTDNWAPDGISAAYWIRITQTGGPWELRGMQFVADAERALVNVSAGNLVIPDSAATSSVGQRFTTPSAAAFTLSPGGAVRVWGDPVSLAWRLIVP